MKEQYFEKLLNIKTSGEQKIFNESLHYNRYEPTSYDVLEAMCSQYEFSKEDSLIDFGCGKGRLNFYLSQNKVKEDKLNFINCFAERYPIDSKDNKFYFFNPFSEQIFIKVVGNILDSVSNHERPVDIILYYPSDDYIYYLENYTPFSLKKEIKIPNKYEYDSREKILIYELSYLNLIYNTKKERIYL